MLRKTPFVHKLLKRLDKLSSDEIKNHFEDLLAIRERQDQVLDQLEEGVVLFRARGDLLYANPTARAFLCDPRSGTREGSSFADWIADTELYTWLESSVEGLRNRVHRTFDLLAPRALKIRVSVSPLDIPVPGVLLMVLSPQGEASGFSRIQERLESLVRLAGGVAHEIGNPLNAIGIHLELLRKEIQGLHDSKKESRALSHLDVLKAETRRLDQIVKNFLKATRKPPLRFRMENLNELLEDAIHFLQPELKQNKISLSFHPDDSLPTFLLDQERLRQVFINLIKNAMEACGSKGKGKILVQVAHNGKVVSLTFRDNGIGIAEKDLPHIFDAYFTTKKEGSGLGLMTIYQNVMEHGGRVEVKSQPGKGSLFTVLLPIRQPALQIPDLKIRKEN